MSYPDIHHRQNPNKDSFTKCFDSAGRGTPTTPRPRPTSTPAPTKAKATTSLQGRLVALEAVQLEQGEIIQRLETRAAALAKVFGV